MKVLAIRHVPHEGAGTFADFLHSKSAKLEYWDISAHSDKRYSPGDYDAIVSLGGPMGVYEQERFPFIKTELSFLRSCIEAKIPVLGICLGAQMLASVLGAEVKPGPWKEIGWYDIKFEPNASRDRLFAALFDGRDSMPAFHWHGDTFDLPKGADRLAYSALYKNQAFRYDKAIYALQFHIEMTEPMIHEWVTRGKEEMARADSYIDPDAILAETPELISGLQQRASRFYEEFFKLIRNENR